MSKLSNGSVKWAKISPVWIFFDDLVNGDFECDVFISDVTLILVNPELGGGHCLTFWNLSQVETKLPVVSSVMGEILIPLDCTETQSAP